MKTRLFMVKEGKLERIDKAVFTTGDAYLVIDEEGKKIFIWLGKECSVDEKGVAAVEARRIDDGEVFHGQAQIITIDQGHETPEFLAKVQNLIILEKNLAKSMLVDVTTGEFAGQADHVNALYRVSSEEFNGINGMKYLQVPFERSSLDSEDCFVADLGVDVWVWQGKTCNVKEKVKAMQIAREFDAERAGDQRPKVFMEGDGDEEFLDIFEGKLPAQDRATVDLKVDSTPSMPKEEPKPRSPAPKPAPRKAEPQVQETPSGGDVARDSDGVYTIPDSGRLKCPKCGQTNKNMLREVQDRKHIINDYPLIYGKKFICGDCGAHFRKK